MMNTSRICLTGERTAGVYYGISPCTTGPQVEKKQPVMAASYGAHDYYGYGRVVGGAAGDHASTNSAPPLPPTVHH